MVHEKVIKGFERWKLCTHKRFQLNTKRTNFAHRILHVIEINLYPTAFKLFLVFPVRSFSHDSPLNRWACLTTRLAIHVYDSLLLFYAITNRRNYMQSILFHCYVHSTCFGCRITPIIRSTILYQATLGASISDDTMVCTSGCKYSWKIVLLMTGV